MLCVAALIHLLIATNDHVTSSCKTKHNFDMAHVQILPCSDYNTVM